MRNATLSRLESKLRMAEALPVHQARPQYAQALRCAIAACAEFFEAIDGLPNRPELEDRFEMALARAWRGVG